LINDSQNEYLSPNQDKNLITINNNYNYNHNHKNRKIKYQQEQENMNLYKNSNLKSCDIKYNPKLEPNWKSNKRTSFLLSNSIMSLNSSDKKLRSNSSNNKSKSSSGKKLSQSV